MYEEVDAARTIAVRAGAILLEHYSRPAARWKGEGNAATDADRAVSIFTAGALNRLFPKDGILSEQSSDDMERLSRPRVWMVTPLDGAMDFIRRQNDFVVMIGLAIDGIATVGVIYQPRTEKLYYAGLGTGAFVVENRRTHLIRVSNESNPRRMTIAMSRSQKPSEIDVIRRLLGTDSTAVCGSLGLNIGLICEGRAHVYLHTQRSCQWQSCAADLILHEAGGRMTDLSNKSFLYNRPDVRNLNGIVASNSVIHDLFMEAAHTASRGLRAVPKAQSRS
jgi:3'-phosphoadenosine 5'-phosphosulfate (PAPS) 3'-phosphatase